MNYNGSKVDLCGSPDVTSRQSEQMLLTKVYCGGGVLEDVLEDTFWSPWPWPRSLKFSKIALSWLEDSTTFWTVEILLKNARNFTENFRRHFFVFLTWRLPEKIFLKTFFVWNKYLKTFFLRSPEKKILKTFFSENTCVFVLGPWPWEGLSLALASKFFCVLGLGLEPCVLDSTSGILIKFFGTYKKIKVTLLTAV